MNPAWERYQKWLADRKNKEPPAYGYEPTQEEIAAATKAIREGWSDLVKEGRWVGPPDQVPWEVPVCNER